jgi:hypothetical protein
MFPKNSFDSQNKKKSKKEHNSVIIYLCNVYDDEWIELIFCIESPKDK